MLLLVVWGVVRVRWVRDPATQDVLWKVALLAGIITATVTTLRDTSRRREAPQAVAVQAVHPASLDRNTGKDGVVRWRTGPITAHEAGPAVVAEVTRPNESCRTALSSLPSDQSLWPTIVGEACPTPRSFLWQHGVAVLWLLGVLLTGTTLVRRRMALRDALGTLEPAGPRSRAALDRVFDTGAHPPVRLASSSTADAPCVVWGKTIVLPDLCEEQLSDDELDAVLAHELAHVRRRDDFWLMTMRAVVGVFWFQPLNRVAVAGSLEAMELACDDQALARTGRPLGLARSLARVAEWSLLPRRARTEIALVQRGGHRLTRRVHRILARRRPEERRSPLIRLAVAVFLVAPIFMLPSVPAAPVVRKAILYELDAADGREPTLMLLGAVAEASAPAGEPGPASIEPEASGGVELESNL